MEGSKGRRPHSLTENTTYPFMRCGAAVTLTALQLGNWGPRVLGSASTNPSHITNFKAITMYFILFFCQRGSYLNLLTFLLFLLSHKSISSWARKKEAQTQPAGKGSEGCTGAHLVLKMDLGSDAPQVLGLDRLIQAWVTVSHWGAVLFFHERMDCVSVQEAVR